MKKLEMKVVERISVGDYFFNTREEAQDYIDQQNHSGSVFTKNINLLTNFKIQNNVNYIPVFWKDPETEDNFFDFIFEDGDGNSGIHWRGLFHISSLRYVKHELSIVEWNYVWMRLNDGLEVHPFIEAEDMRILNEALTQEHILTYTMAKDSAYVIKTFTKLQISPVYIHD